MIYSIINYLYTRKVFILFGCILCAVYSHYFVQRTYVQIDITPTQKTYLKVYWAKSGAPYSERQRARVSIDPSTTSYGFFIPNVATFDNLRIDPCQYVGEITIQSIQFKQRGYLPVTIEEGSDLKKLTPVHDIERTSISETGLNIITSGNDSRLQFSMPRSEIGGSTLRTIGEYCVIVVLFLFLFEGVSRYRENFSYLLPLYCVVCCLILVMAVISVKNVHPDEYVHIDAAKYYVDNWLPPAIDSQDIRHTYSVYGVSRLNSAEIYYLLAGKFQSFLAPLHLPDYKAFRLFNVGLFFLLLLFVVQKKEFRPLALFLLVSPQIWYLFSYCNSDAFAIFISTIVAYQFVYNDSLLNRYITNKGSSLFLVPFLLGCLLGLLLLSKKNYYFFLLFVGGYSVWKIWLFPPELRRNAILRFMAIALIGCAFFGVRKGIDYSVNGIDRSEKLAQIRSELAAPLYNPNTPLHEKHAYLYMKARGVPFKQIVTVDRWFEKTFRSSFGTYGYFTAAATPAYYNVIRFTALAMFLYLSVSVVLSRSKKLFVLYSWTLFCGSLLIGVSLYHSWTADFQNQGRYLLAIVLMFGMVFWHLRSSISTKFFTSLYTCLFLIALYSFLFVGIFNIPKATPI